MLEMAYVEGFVLAVPRDRIEDYKRLAKLSESFFLENGALAQVECVGDDLPYGQLTSFPRAVQASDDETVVLSWIVYPSKEVRDAANQKLMSDDRMAEAMKDMPTDGKRMVVGGFVPFMGL
jgi:uncharacterized protein YbaA (DUF1428 family)